MSQSHHPLDPNGFSPQSPHDRTAWLRGGTHRCQMPPRTPASRAWRIILLGTSNATKRTQAELLSERLGACRLSINDIFDLVHRAPLNDLSPAMQNALDLLKRGELVPDETILNMVSERLECLQCSGGFVLDGFPQTVAQAKALEQLLESHDLRLTAVFDYEGPTPPGPEKMPDAPFETTAHLGTTTKALKDFYWKQGLLKMIPIQGSPEEMYRESLRTLQLS
jgi:hypothetical protein